MGLSIIAEEWESYDELLCRRKSLRLGWYIVRIYDTSRRCFAATYLKNLADVFILIYNKTILL